MNAKQTKLRDNLHAAAGNLRKAQADMHKALVKAFPDGSTVYVKLKTGQVNWTRALVVAGGPATHSPGEVPVRLTTAKLHSRRAVRVIHYTNVIPAAWLPKGSIK